MGPRRATRRSGFLAVLLLALGILVTAPVPQASAAVQSCSSSTPASARPTLRYGDTGSCVKVLQNLLLAKGFAIGTSYADGRFGPGTLLGVRRYQQSRLDLVIDGVVGPATWNRLVNGGGTAYSVYRGPNTSSRVILSFDDCPTSLSAFKATVVGARNLGIALVLAPTGNCISAGRFSSSYARQYGHWVIIHSVIHPDYTTLSTSSIYYQLGSPGVVTSYGRPPYGAVNERVRNAFATKSMRIWLWNVDTGDWRGKTRSQVVSYVVSYAKPGNTVLMHMQWYGFNTTALSSMKSGLAAKGIGVCRNLGATTPTRPSRVTC
jgi:peptidoglycan hydrolase-like protein with peptidoglycan-binding domain